MSLPYSRQDIGDGEVAAIAAAAREAWITGGPRVERFEAMLAERVGARHAVAVSSGTAALHVAHRAAGVDSGDVVLTSPLTFVATANVAIHCGARPRFADVDARGALDPRAVAQAIARHGMPRVVVPVHYAGHPAPVTEIAAVVPGAIVIEDACHALGAAWERAGAVEPVGSCRHGGMAVFSFHAVKTITTGEGGAIVTNDATFAARCRRLRDHGLVRDPSALPDAEGPWWYEQHELGFNYRLTALHAALGAVQLERLDEMAARRRAIVAAYGRALEALPWVRPIGPAPGTRSAHHLFPVRVPAGHRRAVFDALRARDIGVQVHYIPVHLQPYYRRKLATGPRDHPVAEALYRELLSLPCFPAMETGDVSRVIAVLLEVGERLRIGSTPLADEVALV